MYTYTLINKQMYVCIYICKDAYECNLHMWNPHIDMYMHTCCQPGYLKHCVRICIGACVSASGCVCTLCVRTEAIHLWSFRCMYVCLDGCNDVCTISSPHCSSYVQIWPHLQCLYRSVFTYIYTSIRTHIHTSIHPSIHTSPQLTDMMASLHTGPEP